MNHAAAAELLDAAVRAADAVLQLSLSQSVSLDDAYAIQDHGLSLRLARGEQLAGVKMGFTSKAKMVQMGVSDLIIGQLTREMRVPEGGMIDLGQFIHPRVEPEIAFLLGRPLSGEVTPEEALAAVDGVAPALEIIDSRYQNFKFSLADVVADNCSSAAYVVGDFAKPDLPLDDLAMTMSCDGYQIANGTSAALLDHPANCLAAASRLAARLGGRLEAGWIVLAGAATEAVALKPGCEIGLNVQGLGQIGFHTR